MTLVFDDVRLPEDVERGAKFGPGFKTSIVVMASGREQRNVDWQKARGKGNVGYGISTKEDFQIVLAFHYTRRGRARPFRFKDWSDFEATDELLGVGSGSPLNRDFQLIKTYGSTAPLPYVRTITRPVVGTIVVRVNDVVNTNWTLVGRGLIRFNMGFAPGIGDEVRADFEFDVPVRFETDDFGITLEVFNAGAIPDLPIWETREDGGE